MKIGQRMKINEMPEIAKRDRPAKKYAEVYNEMETMEPQDAFCVECETPEDADRLRIGVGTSAFVKARPHIKLTKMGVYVWIKDTREA